MNKQNGVIKWCNYFPFSKPLMLVQFLQMVGIVVVNIRITERLVVFVYIMTDNCKKAILKYHSCGGLWWANMF